MLIGDDHRMTHDGLRRKNKKAVIKSRAPRKLNLKIYITISSLLHDGEPSPAGISPRSHHELDFALLTLWTRLRVVLRGLDLASTSKFRLSVDLVRTSISDLNPPANAHINDN